MPQSYEKLVTKFKENYTRKGTGYYRVEGWMALTRNS